MITLIFNRPVLAVVDGADSRDLALSQFTASRNGTELHVCDSFFYASKPNRLLQVFRIVWKVVRLPHHNVLLTYPRYPFYWQHKVTVYFALSVLLTLLLRMVTLLTRRKIVLDVSDLYSYAYKDVGLPLEMPLFSLRLFEGFIFTLADELWITSRGQARLVTTTYRVPARKIKVVLNGAFRHRRVDESASMVSSGNEGFRFVYAGRMDGARRPDIENLITAFHTLRYKDVELHLCGAGGEWIPEQFPDSRVVHHGLLDVGEMAALFRTCSVGVIPVPARGYWNIAFPTKFGLYVTHGFPILAAASELVYWVNTLDIGLCYSPPDLKKALEQCIVDRESVLRWKTNAIAHAESFFWDSILDRAMGEQLLWEKAPTDPVPSAAQSLDTQTT